MPRDLFTGQIDNISAGQQNQPVDLFEKYNVRKPYKSILPENIPAPIQAIQGQIAKTLLGAGVPFGTGIQALPPQQAGEFARGGQIGSLQAINSAMFGIPQAIARKSGYEIPQAQTPFEQAASIPLESAGALAGISPFAKAYRMLPVLRKLPATLKSAATLAGYGATKAGFEGEDVGKAALSGATMGGLGHIGARLGATTPLGARLGGAAGFGGTSAGLAALEAPEGEKAQSAALQGLIGTGMGLLGKAQKFPKPNKLAGRFVNSLIKPNNKEFLYGKNPGMGLAKEGIVGTSFESLINKTNQRLKELNNYMNVVMSKPKNIMKRFDLEYVTEPLYEVYNELSKKPATFSANIKRVEDIFSDLSSQKFNNLSAKEALELKRFISDFQDWNKIEGKDKDINIAIRKIYHNIDSAIDSAIPETKLLNERMANLISAKQAIQHRASIVERANILGLAPRLTGMVGGASMGGIPGGFAGYLAGLAAEKGMASPLAKTGIGKLLADQYAPLSKETPYRKPKGPGPITEAELVGVPQPIDQGPVYIAGALPPPQQKIPKITPEALPSPRTAGAKVMTKEDIAKAIKDLKAPVTSTKQRGKFPDERVNKVIYMFDKESQGMLPPKKPVQRTKAEIERMRKDLEQKVKDMLRAQSAAEKRRLEKIAREKYLQWKASGLTTEGGKGGVIQ